MAQALTFQVRPDPTLRFHPHGPVVCLLLLSGPHPGFGILGVPAAMSQDGRHHTCLTQITLTRPHTPVIITVINQMTSEASLQGGCPSETPKVFGGALAEVNIYTTNTLLVVPVMSQGHHRGWGMPTCLLILGRSLHPCDCDTQHGR